MVNDFNFHTINIEITHNCKGGVIIKRNVINTEYRLCPSCMEEHRVQTIRIKERVLFKDVEVEFEPIYLFCNNSGEYIDSDISGNDILLKDAYRRKVGLLTSTQIIAIRDRYSFEKEDFALLLECDVELLSAYESYLIQTKEMDELLRKIDNKPSFVLELLHKFSSKIESNRMMGYVKNVIHIIQKEG